MSNIRAGQSLNSNKEAKVLKRKNGRYLCNSGETVARCLTLGNELSEETHADKARDFIGKGHPGGEQ